MPDAARASKYQRYDEPALQHRARKGDRGLDGPAFPGEVDTELEDHLVMKTRTSRITLLASLGGVSLLALNAIAQTPAPEATPAPAPAATEVAPAKLPYGAEDVLKLTKAQVSEDVTLSFIRNSGTVYNLVPKDIVYLRNEGVSDRVINAMLDQGKSVPTVTGTQAAPAPTPTAQPAPALADPNAAAAMQAQPQYAPVYTQPTPVYVQPDTSYVPPSTVYTIPYSSSAPPFYYSGYPYYSGPTIGIGFGFGYGGYYRGYGYRGGYYHGGYYRGGNYHGGNYHGGNYGHSGHR
jgi:hypothetical protein